MCLNIWFGRTRKRQPATGRSLSRKNKNSDPIIYGADLNSPLVLIKAGTTIMSLIKLNLIFKDYFEAAFLCEKSLFGCLLSTARVKLGSLLGHLPVALLFGLVAI
jgi:hypothetical protein